MLELLKFRLGLTELDPRIVPSTAPLQSSVIEFVTANEVSEPTPPVTLLNLDYSSGDMFGVAVDPQPAVWLGSADQNLTLTPAVDRTSSMPIASSQLTGETAYEEVSPEAETDKPKSKPGEVGRHGDLNAPEGHQSNHLNQDAVFKPDPKKGENKDTDKRIGTNDGAAIIIQGGTDDKTSQHYKFHKSLDDWFQPLRDKGTKPTIKEYNVALEKALVAAGFDGEKVKEAMDAARKNQKDNGFVETDLVPRLPGSRNTPK